MTSPPAPTVNRPANDEQTYELPRADIDTPIVRPVLQKAWVGTLGRMMQGAFFLMTIVADTRNPNRQDRVDATIDTGRTGKCSTLIFLPKNRVQKKGPVGVVVHLHGSGWTVGRPQFEHMAAQRMAYELDTVVVVPNYFKAPKYPYPFALHQMYSVLDWIASGGLSSTLKKHSDGISLDTSRIAISGGSAGGNLAASLALLAQAKPLSNGSRIVALGLLYPHLDAATPFDDKYKIMNPKDVALPPWVSKFFMKAYLPPPRDLTDPYVSPLRAPRDRLALFPPTVVVTAERDYLAQEGNQFAEVLEKAGAQTRLVQCKGVAHAFDLDPGFRKKQKELNNIAIEEAWGTVVDVFRTALAAELKQ